LLARYDLAKARQGWSRDWLAHAPQTMWRYAPVLPISRPSCVISLGEGMTPLLRARRLAASFGCRELWIKDESLNPTGSFKARGLACAVSMAVELGVSRLAIPSAGNAASALAAYAAAASVEAHVFMPQDAPQANILECKAYGAQLTLVDGLISDCASILASRCREEGWFDVSTFKEPYRLEGKKTMGYELAEQFHWELPDGILFPTGGGVGLVGIWKAFEEMEALGWISAKRPKMIAVQTEGCAPIVEAFSCGAELCRYWDNAVTVASGLRVPKPYADFLALKVLRESHGAAVAVSDHMLLDAGLRAATQEGMFMAPEGAACVAALEILFARGILRPEQRIVIFNTGAGVKYLEAYLTRFPRFESNEYTKLGGLITPR